MPANTAHDESGESIPRWAATAGRESLTKRLTTIGARLLCPTRRSRTHTGAEPDNGEAAPLVTVEEFTAANRQSWWVATPPGDHDDALPRAPRRAA